MSKKVVIGTVAGLGVAACIAACARSGACRDDGEDEPKPTVWEKMRKGMEEMPEDFPPRVMFDNVASTKANTDEILALLRDAAITATAAS